MGDGRPFKMRMKDPAEQPPEWDYGRAWLLGWPQRQFLCRLGLRLQESGRVCKSCGPMKSAITLLIKPNFLVPSLALWPQTSDKQQLDSTSNQLEQKCREHWAPKPELVIESLGGLVL